MTAAVAKKTAARPGPKKGTAAASTDAKKDAKKEKPTGPRYTRKEYPQPPEGYKLFEAGPGGAGYINVRRFTYEPSHAADISDPSGEHPNPDWHVGLISRFFPNKEKGEAYKARMEEEGYAVKLLPVRPYKGQGEPWLEG